MWYPPRATREALANALCHRDYMVAGGAVSVAMYDDHLEITNPDEFHFGITPEKLAEPHESRPWNPILANVFYRAGIIERWGMGTLNIIERCTDNGNPHPVWSQHAGSVFVTFQSAVLPTVEDIVEVTEDVAVEITPEVTPEVLLLQKLKGEMSRRELISALGLKDEEHFRKHYILPALEAGLIEMIRPDKPRSSKKIPIDEQRPYSGESRFIGGHWVRPSLGKMVSRQGGRSCDKLQCYAVKLLYFMRL